MKAVHTLVLLANEREARVLVNEGVGKGLRQLRHLDRDAVSGDRIAYADDSGRSRSGPGGAHHKMEPSSSEVRQNRETFAADLLTELDKIWAKGEFDRLAISAPPKMLGAIRDRLPKGLADKLTAEMDKDLLHTPLADLAGHFSGVAAF
ncbi:MAG: host attachment family protein [Rhodobacter sp.]|nr:host attachment family protein [Rhodobacter sp.]